MPRHCLFCDLGGGAPAAPLKKAKRRAAFKPQLGAVAPPIAWLPAGEAGALIPLLGFTLAAAMLAAIVYGLTPDERWDARHNPGSAVHDTRWAPIFGVIVALMLGAAALMATVAFSGQRYFEWQVEEGRKLSQ